MQGLRPFCAIMKRYAGINFKKSQFHHLTAKVGLSGIFASAGINLLTGVLSTDQIPNKWPFIVISAVLNVFASVAWAILAWELAAVERLAIAEAPRFVSSEPVWEKLVATKLKRFLLLLGMAILFVALGIVVLIKGY